ncbi:putative ribonuclease H-like domain-containing protein, partial [Tanacetum coccineum]
EELVSDDKLKKKTVFHIVAKIEFVRPKQQAKPVRKPVKYAEMYRLTAITIKGKGWPKVVDTARPNSAVVNAVRANKVNAVKASACWGHPQKEDQGYVDSGCSRHMIGNMSYLSDFKQFDGGYVTFGGGAKGGKITSKRTLKTADESQVLLKVPRKNNMYSVDMKNIVPKESLTCLVAKATLDESMLWHRRLGHVNFKTINKLVKENLVRGLPTKRFENDETCVACLKGKQHIASYKSKIQNSITQPLFMLHMDLFGLTFVSSLMNKKYCLVVTDDYSRFTWVFFLATKDETSGILKSFITEVENLVDKKVKIIRCDNGTEFKNRVMSEFCEKKGIKKEFSVARTPQQNGVAERRNRTLIEVARTMLAASKLPTIFWAEVVNTACYVQNRVLVVKPHNKTPYELFRGRTPALSFMRPFGCHVTILNTLDYLGKFDGKSDEGFFVGYSMNSTKESIGVGHFSQETGSSQDYILMPLWNDGSLFDSSSKNASNDEPQPPNDAGKKDDKGVCNEGGIAYQETPENSTQGVNTAGPCINTKPDMFSLGDNATLEATHADFFGDETKVDMSNITTTYSVPSTLNTIIHKDHSLDHVIGDVQSGVQTMRRIKTTNEQGFLVLFMKGKLMKTFIHKVWTLVDLPYGKRVIKTKWVYRNKKDVRGIIVRNKARLVAHGYTQEEGIDYDEFFAPVARIEAIRLFLAYASFMNFVVYQMYVKSAFFMVMQKEDGIFISQDKYVDEILKRFHFSTMRIASTPMETSKPLLKDAEAEDVNVHLYRSMIRSLMYLTAYRPDIMFIDSPFDLKAYSDSDYADASLDRKSTTGGCQFLGSRLISWQCKKQTIVSNSTTEAELMIGMGWTYYLDKIGVYSAYLEKSEDNADFAEIDDFLNASPISGPTTLVADETIHEERGDSVERAATTATSLYAEQGSGNINMTQSTAIPNDAFPQGIGSSGSPRRQDTILGDRPA